MPLFYRVFYTLIGISGNRSDFIRNSGKNLDCKLPGIGFYSNRVFYEPEPNHHDPDVTWNTTWNEDYRKFDVFLIARNISKLDLIFIQKYVKCKHPGMRFFCIKFCKKLESKSLETRSDFFVQYSILNLTHKLLEMTSFI